MKAAEFRATEVAYRIQNLRGTAPWKRKVVRTEAALDKLVAKVASEGGEILTRDAEEAS